MAESNPATNNRSFIPRNEFMTIVANASKGSAVVKYGRAFLGSKYTLRLELDGKLDDQTLVRIYYIRGEKKIAMTEAYSGQLLDFTTEASHAAFTLGAPSKTLCCEIFVYGNEAVVAHGMMNVEWSPSIAVDGYGRGVDVKGEPGLPFIPANFSTVVKYGGDSESGGGGGGGGGGTSVTNIYQELIHPTTNEVVKILMPYTVEDLKGPQGNPGRDGKDGKDGKDGGIDGLSLCICNTSVTKEKSIYCVKISTLTDDFEVPLGVKDLCFHTDLQMCGGNSIAVVNTLMKYYHDCSSAAPQTETAFSLSTYTITETGERGIQLNVNTTGSGKDYYSRVPIPQFSGVVEVCICELCSEHYLFVKNAKEEVSSYLLPSGGGVKGIYYGCGDNQEESRGMGLFIEGNAEGYPSFIPLQSPDGNAELSASFSSDTRVLHLCLGFTNCNTVATSSVYIDPGVSKDYAEKVVDCALNDVLSTFCAGDVIMPSTYVSSIGESDKFGTFNYAHYSSNGYSNADVTVVSEEDIASKIACYAGPISSAVALRIDDKLSTATISDPNAFTCVEYSTVGGSKYLFKNASSAIVACIQVPEIDNINSYVDNRFSSINPVTNVSLVVNGNVVTFSRSYYSGEVQTSSFVVGG